ncbi:MAG: glycosyltransferase family 9 protein [Leptospiraceae bacterium]|nr:glycosyltransferase family 9 protein [Leptospiraceae bacterium]MDW8306296.1 glycosyltransferase family 9 protein [Leptospiraceae bacterium]
MSFTRKSRGGVSCIAVVKLASLGDVIQASHVLPLLKEYGYVVHFYTSKSCTPVLEHNPYVDRVFALANVGGSIRESLLGLLSLLWHMLWHQYKRVLLLHRSPILSFVLWLAGKKTVGFYHKEKNPFLFQKIYFNLSAHRMEHNHEMLSQALGITQKNYNMVYFCTKEEKRWAQELLKPSKKYRYLALNAGGAVNLQSSMPSRRYPPQSYAEVLNKLAQEFPKYVFVFLGAKTDLAIHKEIMDKLSPQAKHLDFTGKLSIRQSAALLSACHVYIGNDSFLLFVAIALGIKSFGIFGPTKGELIMPTLPHCRFIQATHPLSGCYNPTEGTKGLAYQEEAMGIMRALRPIDVYRSLRAFLKE